MVSTATVPSWRENSGNIVNFALMCMDLSPSHFLSQCFRYVQNPVECISAFSVHPHERSPHVYET
jgi:hypothetical protein